MPKFSFKQSRILDPREQLDPNYQLALGVIGDDDDWFIRFERIFGANDFFTTPVEFAKMLTETTRDNLELWVSSPGGSIKAASHIVELLQDQVNKGKNILVKNIVYAMSAATFPFVSLKSKRGAGTVKTECTPTSIFMIHAPLALVRWLPRSNGHPRDGRIPRPDK